MTDLPGHAPDPADHTTDFPDPGPRPGTDPPEGDVGPLDGEPTRLHPAVMAVWAAQGAVSLFVLIVFTGIVPAVGGAILLALVGGMVLRYLRFRWHLEPDAVVIEEGILVRKRRVIRRDRIQTVDLERGITHRLLGVVEVRIEAIGGSGTEGRLSAVQPALAESLRRSLLSRRVGSRAHGLGTSTASAGPDEVVPEERVVAQVPPEGLILAGLTGGRVGVVAALVGFFFQAVPETWWAETFGRVVQQVPDPTTVVGLRVLIVFVVFALLVGFFLSVVATVFAHWDFTLSEGGETLGVRRGLFTEHRDTVPFRRIQAVQIEENLLRRLLRRGALRAVVAGRVGLEGSEGRSLLLPIGRRNALHVLAGRVVGLELEGPVPLEPMPPRARKRRMARALFAAVAVGVIVSVAAHLYWEASFWRLGVGAFAATLLPGLLLAEGAYRNLGWADLGSHVVVSQGVLNRTTTYVPTGRLQVLETTANPFQRLGGLATLHLQVARPVMGATPRALDLSRTRAEDWRESLAARVAASGTDGVTTPTGT